MHGDKVVESVQLIFIVHVGQEASGLDSSKRFICGTNAGSQFIFFFQFSVIDVVEDVNFCLQ